MGCFHDVMIIKPRSEPRIYGKHLFSFSVFFFSNTPWFFFSVVLPFVFVYFLTCLPGFHSVHICCIHFSMLVTMPDPGVADERNRCKLVQLTMPQSLHTDNSYH